MLKRFGFPATCVLLIPVQLPRKLFFFETLEKKIMYITQACKRTGMVLNLSTTPLCLYYILHHSTRSYPCPVKYGFLYLSHHTWWHMLLFQSPRSIFLCVCLSGRSSVTHIDSIINKILFISKQASELSRQILKINCDRLKCFYVIVIGL